MEGKQNWELSSEVNFINHALYITICDVMCVDEGDGERATRLEALGKHEIVILGVVDVANWDDCEGNSS
jgi:hypothetical protein